MGYSGLRSASGLSSQAACDWAWLNFHASIPAANSTAFIPKRGAISLSVSRFGDRFPLTHLDQVSRATSVCLAISDSFIFKNFLTFSRLNSISIVFTLTISSSIGIIEESCKGYPRNGKTPLLPTGRLCRSSNIAPLHTGRLYS